MIIPLRFKADDKACYTVPYFAGRKYEPKLIGVSSVLPAEFTEEQFAEALGELERTVEYGHVSVHLVVRPRMDTYNVLEFIASQSSIVYEHICRNITPEEGEMMRNLMNDKLVLRKQNGEEIPEIMANVQPGKVFIADGTVPLKEGDTLIRELPNGLTESYVVEDRGYFAKIGGIQAHYQAKVRKKGAPVGAPSQQTVWNVSGPNARVNINSQDSSTNIVTVTPQNVIAELRKAITAQMSGAQRDELVAKLDEMSAAKDKDTKLARYQQFIALAANITTIVGPYLPALAAWLAL